MIANDYITEKVNIAYKELSKCQLVLKSAEGTLRQSEARGIKEYLEYAKKNIEIAIENIERNL